MAKKIEKKTVRAKQAKAQIKKGVVKVGVLDSIVKIITDHGPISKGDIAARLAKLYPDREPKGLLATVKAQLPTRILKGRDIKLNQSEDHLFSIVSKKPAPKDKAQAVKAPQIAARAKEMADKELAEAEAEKNAAFRGGKIVKQSAL